MNPDDLRPSIEEINTNFRSIGVELSPEELRATHELWFASLSDLAELALGGAGCVPNERRGLAALAIAVRARQNSVNEVNAAYGALLADIDLE